MCRRSRSRENATTGCDDGRLDIRSTLSARAKESQGKQLKEIRRLEPIDTVHKGKPFLCEHQRAEKKKRVGAAGVPDARLTRCAQSAGFGDINAVPWAGGPIDGGHESVERAAASGIGERSVQLMCQMGWRLRADRKDTKEDRRPFACKSTVQGQQRA